MNKRTNAAARHAEETSGQQLLFDFGEDGSPSKKELMVSGKVQDDPDSTDQKSKLSDDPTIEKQVPKLKVEEGLSKTRLPMSSICRPPRYPIISPITNPSILKGKF